MADNLPDLEGGAGRRVEATPVLVVDASGAPASQVGGTSDGANSTEAALGTGATFTGPWVTNNDPHIGFNLKADQPGTFYVEFSTNGGATVTLSKAYDIRAGESRFDALVKGSRSHRVRFVNGATAQGAFTLLTFTGDSLFPYSVSERDEPVFAISSVSNATTTTYIGHIDLSNRTDWPHKDVGRIDLVSANFFYDKTSSCRGALRLGVITRIDAESADLAIVLGTSFDNSDLTKDTRDRELRNPIKLGQSGGELTRVFGAPKFLNITALNTVTPIATGRAGLTMIPAVGDVIARYEVTAGTLTSGFISGHYVGNVSAT